MIAESILALFFFIFSYYIVQRWNGTKTLKGASPPSLPSLPFIGSLPFLRNFSNLPEFFMKKSYQLGPIFTIRAGRKLALILNTTETINEAFVKNSRCFSSRPEMYLETLVNPKSRGILFINPTQVYRRAHQSSLSILKDFGFGDKNLMEERIMREVEAMIDYLRNKNGKSFAPKELFVLVTSNIMMNMMFGHRNEYHLGIPDLVTELARFGNFLDVSLDVAPFLRFVPLFQERISGFKDCNKTIHGIIEKEIDNCLQSQADCFVSKYMEKEGTNYDRAQLNFLLRDLGAAGIDTTTNTFLWSLVALANHPEIQKKLHEEMDSVMGKDRSPTLHDQSKLPYVEATILELYRWRTLVPLSIFHQTSGDSYVGNFFIPSETIVIPNLYAAHGDPNVWKNPESFQPERFLDKDNNVIGRDRIIPFSLGRRSCLGEMLARSEVFLVFASLLQRFTVLPPEGQDKISDNPFLPVAIVQPPVTFSVRLVERH